MSESDLHELIRYRIQRAKETVSEVPALIELSYYNTAVNRIYYACYYAIIALLLKHQITTQTHAGVRQMFGLHFIKTGLISSELGKFYNDIFDKRQIGDYDDFVVVNEEDVVGLFPSAKELVSTIEQLIRNRRRNVNHINIRTETPD